MEIPVVEHLKVLLDIAIVDKGEPLRPAVAPWNHLQLVGDLQEAASLFFIHAELLKLKHIVSKEVRNL